MVTMPMVSMPCSRAMRATTGAAPVPVPPPMPAVMNTILVLSVNRSAIFSSLSKAAWRATEGTLPAPSPVSPISSLLGTEEFLSACSSVLHTQNDTFSMFWLYMCCTALLPPPPTPITFMMLLLVACGMNSDDCDISSIVMIDLFYWC